MRFVTTSKAAAFVLLGALGLLGATPSLDGAHIVNSGSTNTAAWSLTMRSDGAGTYTLGQRRYGAPPVNLEPRAISVPAALAQRLLADAKAARAEDAPGGHCMKSASFGSTTVVTYHGWTSPDLQCPSSSSTLAALAGDVGAIQKAANLTTMPRPVRLPPNELRRVNTPTPRTTP
ncbi:MAG: hypothetical protein ACYDGM_06865 [Vulcanimicrobiaceae bacterium]